MLPQPNREPVANQSLDPELTHSGLQSVENPTGSHQIVLCDSLYPYVPNGRPLGAVAPLAVMVVAARSWALHFVFHRIKF